MSKEAEKKAVEESRGEEAQLLATKKQLRESSLELERLKGALNAVSTSAVPPRSFFNITSSLTC